jgi:type VI secretion system protein ImpH
MAGQIGENTSVVGDIRPQSSEIIEELQATPGNYAFVQAVTLAARFLRGRSSLPLAKEFYRFKVNPSLAFPPADIESLQFSIPENRPARVDMILNLMGLHGADSPLPAYFIEHVAQHQDDPDSLRDFFDIFNHKIISLLFSIWGRYHYYAQYQIGANDILSRRFFSFIGAGLEEIRSARTIQWPRLMAYMGLIALNGEATGSLESILRHYFGHGEISIIPCIPRWVDIPEDQQTKLGVLNGTPGEDFILGNEIQDQSGKFRIRIYNLSWTNLLSFLPCNSKFTELKDVVNYVLKSRLTFDVELLLKPGEIGPWLLGSDESGTFLGWSTWCGIDGEGTVILETDYEEF